MSRTWWLALQVTRRLWFRATLYAVIAVAIAVLGIIVGPLIPDSFSDAIGAKAVDDILTIIASSMLAVTTFSLSTLVSATTAAATSGTPRAISLLLRDRIAQSALSSFLGAFLFSLVGLIALSTGLYGGGGRVVLFAATIGVILLIVTMLLRWIDHLAGLGQVSETVRRVADSADSALADLAKSPCLGGAQFASMPPGARPFLCDVTGYLRYLDVRALSEVADGLDCNFYIGVRPGDFCSPAITLLHFDGKPALDGLPEDTHAAIRKAFTIGSSRSFDQDPQFGLAVLSEVALRALSPGINDPGTAVDVVSQAAKLLTNYADRALDEDGRSEVVFPRLHIPSIPASDLVAEALLQISRDGADKIEVGLALQRALAGLAASRNGEVAEAACRMAKTALARGQEKLDFPDDRDQLIAAHRKFFRVE